MNHDQLVAMKDRIAEDDRPDGLDSRAHTPDDQETRDRLLNLRLLVDVPGDLALLGEVEIERRIIALQLFRTMDARGRVRWAPEDDEHD